MTRNEAIKLYRSFFFEPAVGVDAEGQVTTNPTPASTLLDHHEAPKIGYQPIACKWYGTEDAAVFLRQIADAL